MTRVDGFILFQTVAQERSLHLLSGPEPKERRRGTYREPIGLLELALTMCSYSVPAHLDIAVIKVSMAVETPQEPGWSRASRASALPRLLALLTVKDLGGPQDADISPLSHLHSRCVSAFSRSRPFPSEFLAIPLATTTGKTKTPIARRIYCAPLVQQRPASSNWQFCLCLGFYV